MITRQSVTSIYSLAQIAEQNNVIVLPQAATPLAVLNDALGHFSVAQPEVAVVEASQRKDLAGDHEHSQAIDAMVDMAAEAVQKQLKFSRELVRPTVTDAFERVTKFLDEVPARNLRNSIKEVSLPTVYNEAGLVDMVERFKSQPQIELHHFGNLLPDFTAEELNDRCKTGMSRVDEALKSIVEGSDGIVTRVFNQYFLGKNMFGEKSSDPAVENVIGFVLARNLNMNIPDGVPMELTEYRERTAFFIAEFGRRIFQALRRAERIDRQNALIEYMPPADHTGAEIRVNSSVYKRFIKEGGTPEAIIGACLRGISSPSYKDLLEDAYGGIAAVKANERVIQQSVVAEYEANVTGAIIEILGDIIGEGNFPEGMALPTIKDVKAYMKEKPFRKKFDLDNYVLRVVCGAMYPDYNAYPVLSGMMEYMANDETLTQREAATMVTIDLVGDWLAQQLTTEQA